MTEPLTIKPPAVQYPDIGSALAALIAERDALRTEVERLQAKEVGWFMGDKEAAATEMARLRAEVERLTAAPQDPPRFTATARGQYLEIRDGGRLTPSAWLDTPEQAEALAAQITGAQPAPALPPRDPIIMAADHRSAMVAIAKVIPELDALSERLSGLVGRVTPAAPEPPADTVSLTVSKRAWDELVAETWDMPVDEDAVTGCVFAVLDSIAALTAKDGGS